MDCMALADLETFRQVRRFAHDATPQSRPETPPGRMLALTIASRESWCAHPDRAQMRLTMSRNPGSRDRDRLNSLSVRGSDMARRAAASRDTAFGHGPHDQPGAAPAAIIINPATNDLTLNPTDILDESINVTIPQGRQMPERQPGPLGIDRAVHRFHQPAWRLRPDHRRAGADPHVPRPIPRDSLHAGASSVHRNNRRRLRWASDREERRKDHGTRPVRRRNSSIPRSSSAASSRPADASAPPCSPAAMPPRSTSTTMGSRKSRFRSVSSPLCWPVRRSDANPRWSPRERKTRSFSRRRRPPWTTAAGSPSSSSAASATSPMPITIGFLEITANGPIAVTAVYTAAGLDSAGVSIEVEQIAPQPRVRSTTMSHITGTLQVLSPPLDDRARDHQLQPAARRPAAPSC